MNSYDIKYVKNTPDWASIPVINIENRYLETPDDITACAQICYSVDAFLVHLSTVEKEIRAVEKGLVGAPCEDSCLEFFFCPMENEIRYLNFEVNINGCMFIGLGTGIDDLTRLVVENPEKFFKHSISKTDDGWEIFYEIPYSFIRRFFPDFEVKPGKAMRANCFKCADFSNPPHYMSWNPVEGEPFTFHKPNCFGVMNFTE